MSEEHHNSLRGEVWVLRLYLSSYNAAAIGLIQRLRAVCDQHLGPRYTLEVIDMAANPDLGAADRILALPTLVRKLPVPIRKIIGDFSNAEHLRMALNLPAEPIAA
ncbi:MAG TPA: circadian clock KaiB family protein [Verrucomicrobiae bacterium]